MNPRPADELRIEYLPLSVLKAARRNPKKHVIDAVISSMTRFGYTSPMIINDRTGNLVSGHGRWASLRKAKAAGELPPARVKVINGEWFVPVVRGICFENETEAEAYLLADNQTTILGGWNDGELQNILKELATDELLGGTGFEGCFEDQIDEDDLGPLIDNAAILQKKWQTTHGQTWLIPSVSFPGGIHRLCCGNSTDAGDVRRLMNGQRACLFATDAPYLVSYDGTNHAHKWHAKRELKLRKNKKLVDKYTAVDSDELGSDIYEKFIAVAIAEAITTNAAWYAWHASRKQALLESVWEKYGAFVHQQIVWVKDRPILTRSWFLWQHEPCLFGWVRGCKPKRVAKDYASSVWQFPTQMPGHTTEHPTQKPVELFAIPMRQHTVRGDVCYEPFAGSGTQLVAAESLGRICFAMELSPPFVAVALERLSRMGLEPRMEA